MRLTTSTLPPTCSVVISTRRAHRRAVLSWRRRSNNPVDGVQNTPEGKSTSKSRSAWLQWCSSEKAKFYLRNDTWDIVVKSKDRGRQSITEITLCKRTKKKQNKKNNEECSLIIRDMTCYSSAVRQCQAVSWTSCVACRYHLNKEKAAFTNKISNQGKSAWKKRKPIKVQ